MSSFNTKSFYTKKGYHGITLAEPLGTLGNVSEDEALEDSDDDEENVGNLVLNHNEEIEETGGNL